MKFNLRPYQEQLIRSVFAHWAAGHKRVLMQSGTGTGKTVMFNHITNLAKNKGKRVLIIADRRELIQQAWTKLWEGFGIHSGIILSGTPPAYQLPVQIASIQTLNKRSFPPDIDMVVIDECRGRVAPSYNPIFDYYKDCYFLGVDATPIRTNGKGFDHLYDKIVIGPSIKEMEAAGALVPAKSYINPVNQQALSKLRLTAGDYNEKDLARMMMDGSLTADMVASKTKWAPGFPTLAFAVNIEHSKAIVDRYRSAGIKAEHVDGSFSIADRERIFRDFKTGKIELLSNVGIATYGFDMPEILAVQLARPTKSLSLFLQMVGRGTRPNQDKAHYVLLDHANCIFEHGQPNADRNWTLYGSEVKKKKTPKQFKDKRTGQLITPDTVLPEYLDGAELEELRPEELQFIQACKQIDGIIEKQQRNGYKPMWVYFQYVEKNPSPELNEFAYMGKRLGFNPRWAHFKHEQHSQKAQEA